MNAITKNPFVVTGYIAPEYFCDREKETVDLISNIRNGRNTALISERRMGKTGLIEHAFHQPDIEENYYTFLIDIYHAGSLREFVFLLGKHIFETLKPRGQKFIDKFFATITSLRPAFKLDSVTGSPVFELSLGKIQSPVASLEQIFQYLESANKRCVVAIDEFQQVAKFPEKNTEALLRSHIQHCRNTNFIYGGSIHHMMAEIFLSASRPFYQSVSMLHLKPIEEKKYIDFVTKFFSEADVDIHESAVDYTYRTLDGVTWYMQRVFNEIYDQTTKGDIVSDLTIFNTITELAKSFEPIYQNIVTNLPERQKEVLIAIAKDKYATEITSADFIHRHSLQSPSSVQAAIKQLIAKEIVVKTKDGYRIPDLFFNIWIMMTYGSGFLLKSI
jgi:DNA-binding MarR family transcriptional regulator